MKKPKVILSYIRRNVVSRLRNLILPLYSALVKPHLEHCVQFRAPQYKRDAQLLVKVQQRATEMTDLSASHEEKLRELGLYSLEKGHVLSVYKYLKGWCTEDGARLFSVVPSDRTKTMGVSI